MTDPPFAITDTQDSRSYLGPLLGIAGALALTALAAGLNIYLDVTNAVVSETLAVRWREMVSLLVLTPISVVLLFVCQWVIERGRQDTLGPVCLLLLAIAWLGISMGVHEPFNALFAPRALRPDLLNSGQNLLHVVHFWDDQFSHAVFFASFIAIALALLWSQQRNVLTVPMKPIVALLFLLCSIPASVGMFYSLVGTHNTIDRFVIATALIAGELLRRGGSFRKRPINILVEGCYALGLALLLLCDR